MSVDNSQSVPMSQRLGARPALSVVVPVYNEADGIPFFIQEVRKVLRQTSLEYEVIFAADPSTDATTPSPQPTSSKDSLGLFSSAITFPIACAIVFRALNMSRVSK